MNDRDLAELNRRWSGPITRVSWVREVGEENLARVHSIETRNGESFRVSRPVKIRGKPLTEEGIDAAMAELAAGNRYHPPTTDRQAERDGKPTFHNGRVMSQVQKQEHLDREEEERDAERAEAIYRRRQAEYDRLEQEAKDRHCARMAAVYERYEKWGRR